MITVQLRERLWPFLGGIAGENTMKAMSIGGVADHVHILWECFSRPFETKNAFARSPTLERVHPPQYSTRATLDQGQHCYGGRVGYSRFSLREMPAKISKLQSASRTLAAR